VIILYDLIVIGAGAGGLSCALEGIKKGFKVLLVEKNKPGGECTWSGCIPSKSLINISKDIYTVKKYTTFSTDTEKVLLDIRKIIERVYSGETPKKLKELGIDYIAGEASLLSKSSIKVKDEIYEGKNIILSTGSSPLIPKIKGLKEVDFLTNENIFELKKFPKSITIIGAGAIGIELGQSLNRLGVNVRIIEKSNSILSKEHHYLTDVLYKRLNSEGIKFYLDSQVTEVKNDKFGTEITFLQGEDIKKIYSETLFLALGRSSNIAGLNLEDLGLIENNKLTVDDYLETNLNGIYAVGDVLGNHQFSHVANFQAVKLIKNLTSEKREKIDYSHLGWCTFSSPELATVGEINTSPPGGQTFTYTEEDLDRAKVRKNELFRLIATCDKSGYLVGASILGERAGEIICELQALKSNDLSLDSLSKVLHPYPTYNEIFRKLGRDVKRFLSKKRNYIIDTKILKSLREDYKFIDCRDLKDYKKRHIEGAISLTWEEVCDMTYDIKEPGWALIKDKLELERILNSKGLNSGDIFIIYTDSKNSVGEEARILWTLEFIGLKGYILDKGYDSLLEGNYSTSNTIPSPKEGNLILNTFCRNILITGEELMKNLNEYKILDARTPSEYRGEINYGESYKGRIPTSINIPHRSLYAADGNLKTIQEIEEIARLAGIKKTDSLVTYCTGGIRSSIVFYALREAGFNNIRNYDGSFADWTAKEFKVT